MRLFERPDECAKTGLRTRQFVRLRTGPGCVRGPLRGRKGGKALGGGTEGEECGVGGGRAYIYRGRWYVEVTYGGRRVPEWTNRTYCSPARVCGSRLDRSS